MVPEYIRIPRGVLAAARVLAPHVNPNLLPRTLRLKISSETQAWLPAEDNLLATGRGGGTRRRRRPHCTTPSTM